MQTKFLTHIITQVTEYHKNNVLFAGNFISLYCNQQLDICQKLIQQVLIIESSKKEKKINTSYSNNNIV